MKAVKILLIFLGVPFVTLAQNHNFLNFSIDDGLPQSQVTCQLNDRLGYIWFGTQGGGVSRFDGKNFENISTKDGLSSNYINDILDHESGVLVCTKKGINLIENGLIAKQLVTDQNVLSIYLDTGDNYWVGTTTGLYHINIGSEEFRKSYLADISLQVNDIKMISHRLFIATNNGLYYENNGKFKKVSSLDDLGLKDIKALAARSADELLVGVYDYGLLGLDPEKLEITSSYEQSVITRPQDIFLDEAKNVWVATQSKGVSYLPYAKEEWKTMDRTHGLVQNNIQSIIQDENQSMWLASSGGGVIKYLGENFKYYNSKNGLSGERIYGMAIDQEGKKWLSIANEGISVLDKGGIINYVDGGTMNSKCNHIYIDSQDRKWFSTSGNGLIVNEGNSFRSILESQGMPGNWIKCVVEDSVGNIWAASFANGIAKISNPLSDSMDIEIFKMDKGMSDLFVSTLSKDMTGRIWYGTQNGGLGIVQQDTILSFSDDENIPNTEIRSICFNESGYVFLGTSDQGIYFSDSKSGFDFRPIQKNNKLKSHNIYSLIFDDLQNLWAGSEKGIDQIVFSKHPSVEQVVHYGKTEGFLGIENCHNSIAKDKDGSIWFGTMNGLVNHFPGNVSGVKSSPKLHFEEVMVNYKNLDSLRQEPGFKKRQLELPYNNNQISFNYKSVDINAPDNMRYQYSLSPVQGDWSPLIKAEQLNFNALPAGSYSFKVRALNDNGNYSNTLQKDFVVKQAFWKSFWFQVFMGLALIGLVLWIFNRKMNSIRKSEKKKRDDLRLENQMLQLEQKALQLQMNPHFIFNALNGIQSLVATNKQDEARTQIQNFAQLMRKTLTNSKKQNISLAEEIASLEKYIELEKFCQKDPFEYSISIAKDLETEDIEIPPMILQPFVENAIIHGLANKKGKKELLLEFFKHKDILTCQIIDNGIGRKAAEKLKEQRTPGHQSVALEVNRERLQNLKGSLKFSALDILDRLESDGEVGGTQVIIRLPLTYSF